MKIWWGFRFSMDLLLFYVIYKQIVAYPRYLWRYGRSENVRWNQRRRGYVNNPYFTPEKDRKLQYDSKFRIISNNAVV
jgi:hypothetical protein